MKDAEAAGHSGEVVSVENNRIKVRIQSASACSTCHAKGACSAADFQDKYIETKVENGTNYLLGEKVRVECGNKQGFYALFWAYVLPMLLVVTLLFVGFALWDDELKAGILSLGILPIYYFGIYLKRKFFDQKLQMNIKKTVL